MHPMLIAFMQAAALLMYPLIVFGGMILSAHWPVRFSGRTGYVHKGFITTDTYRSFDESSMKAFINESEVTGP